jgi:hypothetical protein
MARTSEGMSFVAADVEVSQDGVVWIDLAPYGSSVATGGGDRRTGEVNVFDDERPIVTAGKKGSQTVNVRYVYTEEAGGPFEEMRDWDDAEGGAAYCRYWVAGKVAGNFVFATEEAIITMFEDPGGEAGSGDPVLCEIQFTTEEITKDTWVS